MRHTTPATGGNIFGQQVWLAPIAALPGLGILDANLRLNAGNIGGSVEGVFGGSGVFIPWTAFAASDGRVLETPDGFTPLGDSQLG